MFAIGQGNADLSRVVMFDTPEDKGIFLAVTAGTTLAFFAMVGFEDSVNMAEEVKRTSVIFPKIISPGSASPARSTSWCRSPRSPWCHRASWVRARRRC